VTDTASTLGELVLRQPSAAGLFERLGLDYCCGGRRSLEQACGDRDLDASTVGALLDALDADPGSAAVEAHDVAGMTTGELCDHIVTRHHDALRRDMPRITDLLGTVVRVHGGAHAELLDLQRQFAATRAEVETHLQLEEEELFPASRAVGEDGPAVTLHPALLTHLEDDHATTGEALQALRELTDGYRTDTALCATHRTLLQELRAFELDMHQHVHEENNVLFARVRARVTGP
jgi:regulator of cell morphogenesis and NO signaling